MVKPFGIEDLGPDSVIISHSQAQDGVAYRRLRDEATRRNVPFELVSDSQYHELMGLDPPKPVERQLDADGCVTDSEGNKVLLITRDEVEGRGGHRRYLAAKAKAVELGVQVQIVE